MSDKDQNPTNDAKMSTNVTRREFIKYSAGTAACISLGAFSFGCSGSNDSFDTGSMSIGEILRFVFLADSRGESLDNPINKPVLKAIISQIKALSPKPAFVVFGGDMAYRGYIEPSYTFQTWKDLFTPLTSAGITLYTAIGNHELYHEHSAEGFILKNQEEYQKVFKENPGNGPSGQEALLTSYERLVYSFSSPGGDAFFAVLDPYYLIADNTDPNLGGTIDDTQLKWLTAQVAGTNATHKFLFIHTPYYYVSADPEEPSSVNDTFTKLWTILDDNRFDFYACGHSHLYSRKTIDSSILPNPQTVPPTSNWQNNVVQLLNGTCGAGVDRTEFTPEYKALWNIANDADTYYFSVVDISGDLLTVNSYKGNTGAYEVFDSFTVVKDRSAAYIRDNIVEFIRYVSLNNITYNDNGQYSITSGQPWGGLITSESEGSCTIDARAGRKGSSGPAQWFKDRASVAMSASGSWGAWPNNLNFAFDGILIIDGNSYQLVVGQGNDGVHNNWWIGGIGFTSDQVSLITPDKEYSISQFDVSFNQFYVEPRN